MSSGASEPKKGEGPAQPLRPGLYIVATPIGNLADVTRRALDVLARADLVLAEDTRVTRKLLDAYGVKTRPEAYHEHNAGAVRPRVLEKLAAGATVALVSDAGTPLVSDPGYKLVRAAREAGCDVFPIPGASAVLAALSVAGLPSDRFLFAGFAPSKAGARKSALAALARVPATLIFFETGSRLAGALCEMSQAFGVREAAVARELTKLHEEVRRGSLADLAASYAGQAAPKGEIVVLIGPPGDPVAWNDDAVDAALGARLSAMPLKSAVAEVTEASGRARREVYARALALKDAR